MNLNFSAENVLALHRKDRWTALWPRAPAELDRKTFGFADFNISELIPFGHARAFEQVDHAYVHALTRRHLDVAWYAVGVYLAGIFIGQRLMADQKPFQLRRALVVWNFALFSFSLIGSLRVVPQLLYGHLVNPAAYFVCRQSLLTNADPAVYFWMMLFIYSKFFELVDTLFLVLRKRPVNFLHYFHHSTVLLYCWHSWANQTSSGIYFVGMNYVVHTVMYFYYCLAALGRPPRWGMLVTILQIAQMFGGIGINVFHYSAYKMYPNCDIAFSNLYAALAMYTAYMALFVNFFFKRYCRAKAEKHSLSKDAQQLKLNGTTSAVAAAATQDSSANSNKSKTD